MQKSINRFIEEGLEYKEQLDKFDKEDISRYDEEDYKGYYEEEIAKDYLSLRTNKDLFDEQQLQLKTIKEIVNSCNLNNVQNENNCI